jgi:hypothetical protein
MMSDILVSRTCQRGRRQSRGVHEHEHEPRAREGLIYVYNIIGRRQHYDRYTRNVTMTRTSVSELTITNREKGPSSVVQAYMTAQA